MVGGGHDLFRQTHAPVPICECFRCPLYCEGGDVGIRMKTIGLRKLPNIMALRPIEALPQPLSLSPPSCGVAGFLPRQAIPAEAQTDRNANKKRQETHGGAGIRGSESGDHDARNRWNCEPNQNQPRIQPAPVAP